MDIKSQEKFIEEYLELENEEPIGGMFTKTISLEQLKTLLNNAPDFIDLNGAHNDSPTVQQFLNIGEINEDSTYEAYIFLPKYRDDYRISIVAVLLPYTDENVSTMIEWLKKNEIQHPDEFFEYKGNIRAWWD